MALYSDKVMDHFLQPRNLGVIEDADGVGEVGNAKCGDIMKMYLKIDDDIITDVKFETFGSPYSPRKRFRQRWRIIKRNRNRRNPTSERVGERKRFHCHRDHIIRWKHIRLISQ